MSVCAVICTYNRRELLLECLSALAAQTRPLDRVIIVDNASSDGTLAAVAADPATRRLNVGYIEMSENTGASGGFAEGVEQALAEGHDWLWMIDNDCAPAPDALECLLDSPPAQAPDTVAVCSALRSVGGQWQVVYRGRYARGETRPLERGVYEGPPVEVDYAAFAGLLVRADAAAAVGGPKAEFFLWVEDLEWCLRLRRRGAIWLVPDSVVVHNDGNPQVAASRFAALALALRPLPDAQVWKHIVCFRNMSWVRRHYEGERLPGFLRHLARHWVRVLMFDRRKLRRLRWYLEYGLAGRRGTFANCQADVWIHCASAPDGPRELRAARARGIERRRRRDVFDPEGWQITHAHGG